MSTVRLAASLLGLCFVAVAAIAALEGSAGAASRPTSAVPSGRTIWLRDCAVCHRADGSGSDKGPDIRRVGTASVDFMVTTGRMPLPSPGADLVRRTPHYTAAEIDALVRYTATLTNGPTIPKVATNGADLAKGSALYSQECASCHQAAGGGGALAFGEVAPALRHATPTQVVEAMRTGPGTMPVFGRQSLDATQAAQIAAYVQQLRHPANRGGAALGHLGPVPEGLVAWIVGLGALLIVARLLGTRNLSQAAHAPAGSDSAGAGSPIDGGDLETADEDG